MPLTPDMIVDALRALNAPANAPQIYDQILQLFPGEHLGDTPVASIRARLQESCPQSGQFKGRRRLFRRVTPIETRAGMWALLEGDVNDIGNDPDVAELEDDVTLNDIENINDDPGVGETERKALVQARIGQGRFRRDLCVLWENSCAVTGVSFPELLRASHIKPWRESNNIERLDGNNGLLLIATLDAAFDKNLISFRNDGSIIFSNYLGENPHEILGIPLNASITRAFNDDQINYLRFHRERLA